MTRLSRRQFLSAAAGTTAAASTLWLPMGPGSDSRARGGTAGRLRPVVEREEDVYHYEPADNGSGPMWCHGNTCLVRLGDDVFASGLETLRDYAPLNNCRWTLFQREPGGWQLAQADEKGRTREPCPLGCFSDGRVLMSVNPTLTTDPKAHAGPARPEILQFAAGDARGAYKTLLPQWANSPRFTEHSYRSFATDGVHHELVLFQNIGYTHSCWAFLDRDERWTTGELVWLPREDPSKAPYGSTGTRVNYPNVALKDRAVHFLGNSAFDQWERMPDVGDSKRQWGPRFRKLYYTWSDDIRSGEFSDWIEIDNCYTTGGWLFSCDLHVAADGDVHMLWHENPIHLGLRNDRFPDIERVWALKYAVVRRGQVLTRRTLMSGGEVGSTEIPGRARFHVMPDGRLFVVGYVHGRDQAGASVSENRLIELLPDGTSSPPIRLAMEHPLTVFFTATPRAGCAPSTTLDLLGTRAGSSQTISYARIALG
jgi:hypothetical protein